ncbi:MAG: hypothetical protein ABJB01_13190 [Rudaea sp.]
MARTTKRHYERRVMIAMAIYVVLLMLVWPQARSTPDIWLKIAYALTPIVPLLYVIWLMAQRIFNSDELEQRTHLIGLGAAAAVVSIVSLVCGFLAVAKVMTIDGASIALIWIFPILMITYGGVRSYAARRYGSSGCDDDDEGMPMYVRFSIVAVMFCAIAAFAYYREHDEQMASFAMGVSAGIACAAIFFGVRYWLRRHAAKP